MTNDESGDTKGVKFEVDFRFSNEKTNVGEKINIISEGKNLLWYIVQVRVPVQNRGRE